MDTLPLPPELPAVFTASGQRYDVRAAGSSTVHYDLGLLTVDTRSGDPGRIRAQFMHELVHIILDDSGLGGPLAEGIGPEWVEDFVELFSRRLNGLLSENHWVLDMRGGAVGAAVEEAVRAAEGVVGC